MGVDWLKITLETEDCVQKAEHINPIKAHLRSKEHLLTPALKEIRRTRAERLLQWHAENGHENILFMDKKIFTLEEQCNNQNNKIYAQLSHEVCSEGAGGHHTSCLMVWWGLSHQGVAPLYFCEKMMKLVPECVKRTCYKEL